MVTDIAAALSFISPDDRDTWVCMGMAVKAELGDSGFSIWDTWSRGSSKYRSRDANNVWRSIHQGGGVGIGSLYHEAKLCGWNPGGELRRLLQRPYPPSKPEEARPTKAALEEIKFIMDSATPQTHPYLASKGFPNTVLLVHESRLVIPMRNEKQECVCLQMIDADGSKKFTHGGKASGAVFSMGPWEEH